jgi:hypothetical protein
VSALTSGIDDLAVDEMFLDEDEEDGEVEEI